ncbi:hypothetical protein CHS0354_024426 [Potamilus streckersoni]|uniref:Uncharacterized protein n=1 Tax=Potamilus streckersoni TaxID=2493646 RepID=A0AAE0SWZ8_9BIVA|nr:hypothetical protein CHS0354_024426 [Potamilus streckersoni]
MSRNTITAAQAKPDHVLSEQKAHKIFASIAANNPVAHNNGREFNKKVYKCPPLSEEEEEIVEIEEEEGETDEDDPHRKIYLEMVPRPAIENIKAGLLE